MRLRPVRAYLPLLLLCILLSTRWMFVDRWPAAVSTAQSKALASVLACVVCTCFALRTRKSAQLSLSRLLVAAAAGALLFAGVDAGQISGSAAPRSTDLIIALALTPVVLTLARTALGHSETGVTGTTIAPGLAAATALLLLAPEPRLTSVPNDAVLLGAPVAVGLGATWLVRGQRPFHLSQAVGALAGAACLFALLSTQLRHEPVFAAAVTLDALTMLLMLATLASLDVWGFAAQFAIVPLVSFIEYLVFAQVRPTWQQAGGVTLLTAAVVLLLRPQCEHEQLSTVSLFPREQ